MKGLDVTMSDEITSSPSYVAILVNGGGEGMIGCRANIRSRVVCTPIAIIILATIQLLLCGDKWVWVGRSRQWVWVDRSWRWVRGLFSHPYLLQKE